MEQAVTDPREHFVKGMGSRMLLRTQARQLRRKEWSKTNPQPTDEERS